MDFLDILLKGRLPQTVNQPIGTPPFNPNAPDPRIQAGATQSSGNMLDQFLNKPGGAMLMNLLAQSGYSTTPQSPFGAIGRAALQTQQQGQMREAGNLQNELLRARIGLTNAQAAQGGNPSAGNVQSTFEGENGNMWIVTRSGATKDTGVKYSNNLQLIEQADGTVIAVDRRSGQTVGTPVTPESAAQATTRAKQTEKAQTLPTDLAGLDSTLASADRVIGKIEDLRPLTGSAGLEVAVRGNLPYPLGGDARTLKQQAKSLQANFGFDTLQKMRAASKTGGALGQVSERELDLLINALESIDIEGDPAVLNENLTKVVQHYTNYKREIEQMKAAMQREAGQEPTQETPDLSSLSDEELMEIIRRGN